MAWMGSGGKIKLRGGGGGETETSDGLEEVLCRHPIAMSPIDSIRISFEKKFSARKPTFSTVPAISTGVS